MFKLVNMYLLYTCAFVIINLFYSKAFNVDIENYIVHTSPQRGVMFGYDMTYYQHDNDISLLVGAPKYNTDQPHIREAGAVIKCGTDFSSRCTYVPFDISGNAPRPNYNLLRVDSKNISRMIEDKNEQWFGATVSSKEGIVLACAPRYVYYTDKPGRREPVGTCYVASRGLTKFQEYSPCRTTAYGYHRQGFCQAGFSATLTKDAEIMYIGAPGAYYWQGQLYMQGIGSRNPYNSTSEGQSWDDNNYLGYSVSSGEFNFDGIPDAVVSSPHGSNDTGEVVIYSYDLEMIQNITGFQFGSYFGYCLAVLDFNGDGKDDVVVGAPLYTDYEDREMKIEVGSVYVFFQDEVFNFERKITFIGTVNRARLGMSVANIGDINLDGFKDIAVGAPYGGSNGGGAVYIFHGFNDNINDDITFTAKEKAAQVIEASHFGQGLTTFGWSLAGGVDVDRNAYPDLSIGAYESDRAFVFRSRPIIKFKTRKMQFVSESKKVDLEKPNCSIRSRGEQINVSCISLKFCLEYEGINVDNTIELEVSYMLDVEKNSEQRNLFEHNNRASYKEKLQYRKDTEKCTRLKTFVRPDLDDKLSPLKAKVTYRLLEKQRPPRTITPVLEEAPEMVLEDSITIKNNCGEDDICIPNLAVAMIVSDSFIIGKGQMLSTDISVVNAGEDAFETMVYITVPKGLHINKFIQEENGTITWTTVTVDGDSYVVVDVGNPLPSQQEVHFKVIFQLGFLHQPQFEFIVKANSTNAEIPETSDDNVIRKVVEGQLMADIKLYGSSLPDELFYNKSLYDVTLRTSEAHIGPSVVHIYHLISNGPSDVENADIVILWPFKTNSGNYLLYLMEQPITVGNVKCDPVPNINPRGYTSVSEEERAKLIGSTNRKSSKYDGESHVVYEGKSISASGTSQSSDRRGSSGSSYESKGSSGGSYESRGGYSGGSYESTGSSGSSSYSGSSGSHGYGGSSSGSSYSSSSSASSGSTEISSSYHNSSYKSESSSSHSYGYSRDGSGSYHRTKREIENAELWERLTTECGSRVNCITIRCSAGPIPVGEDIYIYLRSRLYIDTVEEDPEYKSEPNGVRISSRIATRAKIAAMGLEADDYKVLSQNVTTPVKGSQFESRSVPWWVILLATLAGLLILLILILILWRCGYFKRRRPRHKATMNDATQPLNPSNGSNGHNPRPELKITNRPMYPGDEAL